MTSSDIKFYHSGGASNNDPEADLGGDISAFELSSTSLDNLFDTLSSKESRTGMIDYRCFYVTNTSSTESLRNAKIFLDTQKASGSYIELGFTIANEIQKVTVSGTPNEGETMTLQVDSENFVVEYSINTTIWKDNFQTAIRSINGLKDVIIDVAGEVPSVTFTVNFLGQAASKDFPTISLINSTLGDGTISPIISDFQDGSPVNTTAVTIETKNHIPSGVVFNKYLRGNPVLLGNLRPNESFPVWVRRTTPPNTMKKTDDNFVLTISGNAA